MLKEIIIPLGTLMVVAGKIVHAYYTLKSNLQPLIAEAERRSLDGILDKEDRKACVMSWIASMEASGKLKIGWVQRKILEKVVDYVAGKMPDFKVMRELQKLPNGKA